LSLYCAKKKGREREGTAEIEISDGGAIKKYGVAGRAKGSKRSRPVISLLENPRGQSFCDLCCFSPRSRRTHFSTGWRDKCCPRDKTERCFHEAALFFLRLRSRIQFFLPLLVPLAFVSALSSSSPSLSLSLSRLSPGRHFVFNPRCDGGSFDFASWQSVRSRRES